MRHTSLPAALLFSVIAPLALSSGPALADHLGPAGNLAIENPSNSAPESDAFEVAIATGDFDGDGIADLAVADREHPTRLRVYRGRIAAIGEPFTSQFEHVETVTIPTIVGTGPLQNPAPSSWPSASPSARSTCSWSCGKAGRTWHGTSVPTACCCRDMRCA
jgi:hypothetical protein